MMIETHASSLARRRQMRSRPIRAVRLFTAILAVTALFALGCARNRAPVAAPTVATVTISLFRGVDANANNGHATLSPSQFNFNPSLSTFSDTNSAPVEKRCNFEFFVSGIRIPPNPGDQGTVDDLAHYVATFDNNPPGHWGIDHPANVTPIEAKAAVSAYAQAHRGQVVNGTLTNCN